MDLIYIENDSSMEEVFCSFNKMTKLLILLRKLVSFKDNFWKFYDSHKDHNNILIDSRLINYIAFVNLAINSINFLESVNGTDFQLSGSVMQNINAGRLSVLRFLFSPRRLVRNLIQNHSRFSLFCTVYSTKYTVMCIKSAAFSVLLHEKKTLTARDVCAIL